MGIVDKLKKRIPIVGSEHMTPRPAPPPVRSESSAAPQRSASLHDFIDGLVKNNKVFMFMKGSPQAPMCGFSANAASILQSYAVDIASFDVLSDPDVRQGVKDYSDWPTIPQVYIAGEFVGGSDILTELHQSGELRSLLQKAGALS
jgi:monothiol glutaredoxin